LFDRARYEPKRVVLASMRTIVRDLDPSRLSCDDAVTLVDWFAEMERLAVAGKTIAAGRAAEGSAWQREGARSPADWLAKKTGSTVGDARGALETAGKLADAPATEAALRAGSLSGRQAEAIAKAAAANPESEQRLLDMAGHQSLQKVRDEAARVIAAATDMEARRARQHRDRHYRTWTDASGAACGAYVLPAEWGAELNRLVKPFIDAAFDQARREQRRESSEAYAADGLLAMARASAGSTRGGRSSGAVVPLGGDVDRDGGEGGPASAPAPAPSPTPRTGERKHPAVVVVNLESLQRGWVEGDELCEIPGVGPVSVSAARELLTDGLLRIVIRDGVDILHVTHAGRCASDVQFTAIQVRQRGACVKPSCRRPIAQVDHIKGYAVTGATSLDDLGGLCRFCHRLKTTEGHTYRRNDDGSITWTRPDGTEEHERPPPSPVAG
jgi:hypothetical protein